MRGLPSTRIEADEIWGFIQKKQKRTTIADPDERGDVWTYVAIDPELKIIAAYRVGKRDAETTDAFIADLKARTPRRLQLSTDGLALYKGAVARSFGEGGIDYAQVVKSYEADITAPGRYSPPKVTSIEKTPIFGEPVEELVSTSLVERNNLTMRMQMRRLTRLTNAHSKLLRNHKAATALHFAHYNFCRVHETIRCTPAMAAGLTKTGWSMDELMMAALDGWRP